MSDDPPMCGAILVGGPSSRMGQPKHALLLPDGRTMIEPILAALRCVCHDVILLGTPAEGTGETTALSVIEDERPGCGPLGGIESLLMSGGASDYLICPCDTPRMTPQLLALLCDDRSQQVTAFQIDGSDRIESLPLRINVNALPIVSKQLDCCEYAIHRLLNLLKLHAVTISSRQAEQLTNINTPSDVDALRQHASVS